MKFPRTAFGKICDQGFTLIEVIAAVGIVGILVSLTLVGIGAARESARKLQCQNNLHQLGVGLESFASSKNHLPPPMIAINDPDDRRNYDVGGAFVALIPYLEISPEAVYDGAEMPQLLQCPSAPTGFSYRFNAGPLRRVWNETSLFDGNGVVRRMIRTPVRIAEISDGLSNTVSIAERVTVGAVMNNPGSVFSTSGYSDIQSLQASCMEAVTFQVGRPSLERDWTDASTQAYGYAHWESPNSSTVDCQGTNVQIFFAELIAARSEHPHGVFALRADGSVFWASDSIDNAAWRALGTRSNDESRWESW